MTPLRLTSLLILLTIGRVGAAQEVTSEIVVVLFDEENDDVVRLQTELQVLGYRPLMKQHPSKSLTSMETNGILEETEGVALINFTMKKGVEIWIGSHRTGSGTLVETIGVEDDEQINASTILKSVESLRASLMRFDNLHGDNKPAPVEKPPEENEKADTGAGTPSSEARIDFGMALELGISTLYGFDDLSPPLSIHPELVFRLSGRTALDLGFSLPAYPMMADNTSGHADVWYWAAKVGVRFYLLGQDAPVAPWLAANIGPTLLHIKGEAARPVEEGAGDVTTDDKDTTEYAGEANVLVTGTVLLRIGLDIKLSERLALQVGLESGWHIFRLPEVTLGEENIRFGNPLVGGKLALVINLF